MLEKMSSVKLLSGHAMPLVGLGTYKVLGDQVAATLGGALDVGYRLFDTAHLYNNETEIGSALKRLLPEHNLCRSDVFLTTKLMPQTDQRLVAEDIEKSLARLQTDYIDLYLIHTPQPTDTAADDAGNAAVRRDTWQTLERFVDAGKLRSIGVSNYEVRHLDELLSHCRIKPAVNQIEVQPYFARRKLREHCRSHGIHVQAFASLGRFNEQLCAEPALCRVAQAHQATVAQVLLAWAVRQGVSVLPKSANADRLRLNFECSRLMLSDDDIASINALNRRQPLTRCAPWNTV